MMKAWIFALALACGTVNCNAALVTFKFTAEVERSDNITSTPFSVQVGDVGQGAFTLNMDAVDTDASPTFGNYPGALVSGLFEIGNYSFSVSGVGVQVAAVGMLQLVGVGGNFPTLGGTGSMTNAPTGYELIAWSVNAGGSNTLLTEAIPDIDVFTNPHIGPARLNLRYGLPDDQGLGVGGATLFITSIQEVGANQIPEPASLALVGAGIFGMAVLRKWRVQLRHGSVVGGRGDLDNVAPHAGKRAGSAPVCDQECFAVYPTLQRTAAPPAELNR